MNERIKVDREDWIEWLQLKGLSDITIGNYNIYFDKLEFEKISNEYFLNWLKRFNNNVSRAMLKNLLHYLKTNEFSKEIKLMAHEFEIPKITGRKKKRILDVLTKDQIHLLARGMSRPRERYMVLLTFYCGLRVSELLNIKVNDIDWENGILKVIGKGNKERSMPIIKPLLEKLANYVQTTLEIKPDLDKLFPIGKRFWQQTLGKISKRVLGRWVNPHLLRHSTGSYLRDQGLDLKEIADFLGHASISTTQIYLHLNKEKLNKKLLNAFN